MARFSQPLATIINIPAGGRALLRFSDLNVTEFQTLASLGIPMHVIGVNARLLRDQDGTNLAYDTTQVAGQKLDGDRPIQLRVERAVDDAHAAFAKR